MIFLSDNVVTCDKNSIAGCSPNSLISLYTDTAAILN